MPKTARQLDREIAQALASPRAATATARRRQVKRISEHETNTKEGGPGLNPPSQGELGIGRAGDQYKSLFWPRVASEYKKEAALRERNSETALRVSLVVSHAPDAHTQYAQVDWGDPMDVRGATKFARELVEDGSAMFSQVRANVSRPTSKRGRLDRGVYYDLARFERDEEA